MSAFNSTILGIINPVVDPRDVVQIPIMSLLEKRRFVKFALENIPGAHQTYNRIFGGSRKASDYPMTKLVGSEAGVPAMLWNH